MIKHVKTLAACLSALLLAGCAASPTPAPTTTCYHVAMIAKSTSTEFWSAVFAGAEAAATEYNMDLTITGSESEEDYSCLLYTSKRKCCTTPCVMVYNDFISGGAAVQ